MSAGALPMKTCLAPADPSHNLFLYLKWWIFSLMCGSKKVSMNRYLNPHLFGEFLIAFSVALHASISETGSVVRMKGAS
jgi:hypothetical protein